MCGHLCGRGDAERSSAEFLLTVDNLDPASLTVEREVFE
jgi:hypothetical protein